MPRCFTCASSSASGMVLIGPHGTPARAQASTQWSRSCARQRLDQDRRQRRVVANTSGVGREALVLRQVRPAEHVAEPRELVVVADCQHEVAVAGAKHVLRLDVGMGIAAAPRRLAGDEIVHRLVGQKRHADVEHADVDVFAVAARPRGATARPARRSRAYMPVMMSTIGTPTFCGPPPGLPSASPVTLISPHMPWIMKS